MISRFLPGAGGLLALYVLSACDLAPEYHPPLVATPVDFKETAEWKRATPNDAVPRGPWWSIFQDSELDALEDRVTAANQNLKVAVAQFQEARAQAKEARAALFPTINATGAASRNQTSRETAFVRPNPLFNDFEPALDLTYEIDVWGRVRNSALAGKNRAQASAGDLASVDLSLHAELAADYFILRGDDGEQDVLDGTVKDYEKALELTLSRYKGGDAAEADVAEAQTQLETAKTQSADTALRRAQLEHAIAILTGVPPSNFSLEHKRLTATPPKIDAILPGELLERRPDVAAAERRVAAANADIGVARAAYYPVFNLTAMFGVEASLPGHLLNAASTAWSIGPSAVFNIFDGGLRDAQNEEALAAYDEVAADYRQTVLSAYGDVEDNLSALRLLEQENITQSAAVAAARRATFQAERRYAGGLASYFDVVTAQNVELSAALTEEDIRIRRMTAGVFLVKALGGGWQREDGLDLRKVDPEGPFGPPKAETAAAEVKAGPAKTE
ncbi:MAG TPA: efflux transporter outer membrane subunit [Aliidongia sp.]|nr:efflux transporter outer membrane subunit [Aliidongia sp.]